IIGYGAIGSGVLEFLKNDPAVSVEYVIVPPRSVVAVGAKLSFAAPRVRVAAGLEPCSVFPDLLVECAGHSAIDEHVIPALEKGVSSLVVSVGALAEHGLVERVEAAAQEGGAQVQLLPGAIGAIDALAAAKVGGLDSVVYTGRKPAHA